MSAANPFLQIITDPTTRGNPLQSISESIPDSIPKAVSVPALPAPSQATRAVSFWKMSKYHIAWITGLLVGLTLWIVRPVFIQKIELDKHDRRTVKIQYGFILFWMILSAAAVLILPLLWRKIWNIR